MGKKTYVCDFDFQPEINVDYTQQIPGGTVPFPEKPLAMWTGSDLPPPVVKNGGMKYDGEKPRMGLIPMLALTEVAKVLTYGAKKYAPDNWRKVDGLQERYYDAALRHLTEYKYNKTDPESNLSHLAHCMCSLMFMLEDQLLAEKA